MKRYDPITKEEIQEAVNLAEFFLMLESAKAYGLLTHPYEIASARCVEVKQAGAAYGIFPQPAIVANITKWFAEVTTNAKTKR